MLGQILRDLDSAGQQLAQTCTPAGRIPAKLAAMDSGLAAVLGALAGAVATTGAAFATGWSTREQARITARGEHRRQRRDARQGAYEEFISAALTHEDYVGRFFVNPVQNADELVAYLRVRGHPDVKTVADESYAHHANLLKFTSKIQLAGPKEVSLAAKGVSRHSQKCLGALITLPTDGRDLPNRWNEGTQRWLDFSTAILSFTELAGLALDDDGTKH